jgi:hypothetical protein
MNIPRMLAVLSLICSVGALGLGLFSTSSMQYEFRREPIGTAATFLILALSCSWPWLLALRASKKPDCALAVSVFSILSLSIALFGVFSLGSTPAEGVGWVIIATLLVVWALYPITSLIKPLS